MTANKEGASRPLTTTQIATCRVYGGDYDVTYTYTYDDNGNILSISDGTYTTSYVYDSQNQLIRENNEYDNTTWTWEYDRAGNILSKKHYAYTTGTLGTAYRTYNYLYEDSWGDVLSGYTDVEYPIYSESYAVDAIGNRTSKTRGSSTTNYTWEHGRQLASVGNWQYSYNNDGMLIEQRNGNNVYTYVYNGTQLSQMTYVDGWEEYTMYFTYDANGTPLTVAFNYVYYMDERTYDATTGTFQDDAEIDYTISDTYYYITNVQGDVIELLNSDGESAGYYRYDAWGYDIDVWDIEEIVYYNPLRYRGYIYDQETGLYYVSSRYYDPEIGRWINADAAIGQIGNVQGTNMFAYCFNNPVNMSDPTGNWPKLSTIFTVVAVAAVAVAAVAVTVATCGAAAPALAVAGGGVIGGISAGAAATATSVATGAMIVAGISTAAAVTSAVAEKAVEKTAKRNNSVYVLKDDTGTVQYVGRTNNVDKRRAAHSANPARAGLEMEVIASGLNLPESRALEQAGMAYYHTINTANKMNNQINSVSPKYWGAFKELALGTLNYGWNQMSNEILYWTGN